MKFKGLVVMMVVALLAVSLPATADSWGVSANIGIGSSTQEFELGRGFYVSIAAVIDGEKVATANTSRGVSIRAPRQIDYEVRFIPRNIKKLDKVFLMICPEGREREMRKVDYNEDGRPDRFVIEVSGRSLPKDDLDLHFVIEGEFDRKTKKYLIVTVTDNDRGQTEQPIPITAVDVRPRLDKLSSHEFAMLHLRRMGWLLLDETVQMEEEAKPQKTTSPPKTQPPKMVAEKDPATTKVLGELSSAIREQNRTNAETRALVQRLLEKQEENQIRSEPPAKNKEQEKEEAPTQQSQGLRLLARDSSGRTAPEHIRVRASELEQNWAIIAQFPASTQNLYYRLKGEDRKGNSFCAERIIKVQNEKEPFTFGGLKPGSYWFEVRTENQAKAIHLEVF